MTIESHRKGDMGSKTTKVRCQPTTLSRVSEPIWVEMDMVGNRNRDINAFGRSLVVFANLGYLAPFIFPGQLHGFLLVNSKLPA